MKSKTIGRAFRISRIYLIIILIFSTLALTTSVNASVEHEVPFSSYYPESNKQWWLYQFKGSGYQQPYTTIDGVTHEAFKNTNCGCSCGAMVINYLKGKDLKTEFNSFISAELPDVKCTARGNYCKAFMQAQGYSEEIYKNGYNNSDWQYPGAEDYQIQNALSIEGIKSHVIKGKNYANVESYLKDLENAINQGKLCIACVSPHEYIIGSTLTSHWTVIYGYDDDNIYLNDPGWGRFENEYPISKSSFAKALWNSSWREIIIIDTVCSATRTMNFEDGVDRQPIKSTIPGMVFTTTDGQDWIYGDWRAGYNGPYPNGMYFSNGNFFAWLGENQGTGRIDFIGATATYLSVLTSTYSGLTMDAYDINDNWLADSGWATNNLNTGQMTKLTVSAPNMAYILVHDTGNYWLIDDLEIGDLLAEAKAYLPASFIAEYEDLDTLDQDQSKWKAFFNKIYQTIKIILGWGGSELSIQIYNPDGVLYDEYQSDTPPIIIDIPDAEPGQWQFKITAIDVPENNYPFALVVGIPDATCPNIPPIAEAGPDQTVAVGDGCMATVTLNGSGSSDPDGDSLTYTWTWEGGSDTGASPSIQLPLGTFAITLVVNDGTADSDSDIVNINVVDQISPDITLSVSPDVLWPPNHKMVLITPTITVADNCDSEPALALTSITMNEGEETDTYDPNYDSTVGDGHTTDDIQVDESGNIYLRAERSGAGNGRIYTITYSATDASGNTSSVSAVVSVPHNQ